MIFLPTASNVTGITGVQNRTWLIGSYDVLLTFCPGQPRTMILLIFAFQVARITRIHHDVWPGNILKKQLSFKTV
jgi:hypothetical protein